MKLYNRENEILILKENPRKISLKELQEKVDILPPKSFGEYNLSLCGLSVEDM